jgi:Fe-S cluster biogenesis protein NfuA
MTEGLKLAESVLDGAKCAHIRANNETGRVMRALEGANIACNYLGSTESEEIKRLLRLKYEGSLSILQEMNERVEAAKRWVEAEKALTNEPPF